MLQKPKLSTIELVFVLIVASTLFTVTFYQMSTSGILPGNDPAIHLVKSEKIEECILEAKKSGACILAVPASDTVTVVSASEDFIFFPSLIWVAQGERDPADIAFLIRPVLERLGTDVEKLTGDTAQAIDALPSSIYAHGARQALKGRKENEETAKRH